MSRNCRSALILCLALFASASRAGPPQAQTQPQPQPPAQAQAQPQPPEPVPAQPQAHAQPGYSAPALYNLANSFARAGKPGLAVLNYERARLLDPKDPDIEANLRHVREASGLPPDSRSRFQRAALFADPRLLGWAGILGLSLAGIAAWVRVGSKSHRRKLLLAIWVGFCMLGVSIANGVALWPVIHEAVVIAPSTPVRVSPVTEEEPLFVLPEAAIVAVRAEHDGFVLVQSQNERSGWVPGASLVRIVPAH
jgi:hypothetical protein